MSELKTYSGNCHCAALKFNIQIPELKSFIECNCKTCFKNGYKWIFTDTSHFNIVRGDGILKAYDFGAGSMVHKFCPTCGTNVLGLPHGKSQGIDVGINARTLMGVDIWALENMPYDSAANELAYKPQEFAGPLPTAAIENSTPILEVATVAMWPWRSRRSLSQARGRHCRKLEDLEVPSPSIWNMFRNAIVVFNGTIFFYPLRPQVSILDPGNSLKAYMMGRKFQQHKFCSVCGVSIHIGKEGLPEEAAKWPDTIQSLWPEILPVNLRILDGVDWDQIVVKRGCKAEEIEPKYVVG
ncbi:hypothetical protein VF21_05529 [Pseudogymnoascus sp. 05NY08]|nr:hypothetical protein VF21_05529 [Pseudogymnoascus sp. 05NY08]